MYYGGGIYVVAGSNIFPDNPRLSGWGTGRENIPEVVMTTFFQQKVQNILLPVINLWGINMEVL